MSPKTTSGPTDREQKADRERSAVRRPAVAREEARARRARTPVRTVATVARWRTVTALVLSLAGLGVSTYLTIVHFAPSVPLACSSNGIVNCERVTTSPQSYVFGIPVAVLGLAFYVAMTAINLPAAWRAADRRVHLVRLAMGIVGICFVLYLVAAELLVIRNICLWCTSVHVVTFLLFVLLVTTVPSMLGWNDMDARAK